MSTRFCTFSDAPLKQVNHHQNWQQLFSRWWRTLKRGRLGVLRNFNRVSTVFQPLCRRQCRATWNKHWEQPEANKRQSNSLREPSSTFLFTQLWTRLYVDWRIVSWGQGRLGCTTAFIILLTTPPSMMRCHQLYGELPTWSLSPWCPAGCDSPGFVTSNYRLNEECVCVGGTGGRGGGGISK